MTDINKTASYTKLTYMLPAFSGSDSGRRPEASMYTTPDPSSRARLFTIDSLNISLIESYKPARHEFHDSDPPQIGNWEQATWVFSDILQSMSGKDRDDTRAAISRANQLVALLVENPSLKHEIVFEHVVLRLQHMLYDLRLLLRAAAYRVLRHAIASQDALAHLVSLKLLIFLIVSLSAPTPHLEKEEALKLVREFVNVPSGTNFLLVGVIKALVAVVEYESDDSADLDRLLDPHEAYGFARLCVETISEIAVLKPDIVFHGGGLRLLINLAINGAVDVALPCTFTLLLLLDLPHARLFLRNGLDLDSLTAVFTLFEDDDEKKAPNTKKYYAKALKVSFVLACFLKSWTGLICFSHDGFNVIKGLLANLKKRNVKLCSIILDFLFDILCIRSSPWLEHSSIGDVFAHIHSLYTKDPKAKVNYQYANLDTRSFEFGIVLHYQGLLVKILINCDLVSLLFNIVNENRDDSNTKRATDLLANVFSMCANLLPPLFYNSSILAAYNADLTLTSMAKFEAATRLGQENSQTAKIRQVRSKVRDLVQTNRVNMDDAQFKACITNTKVLSVKEYDEWNWLQVLLLAQGPLRSKTRFLEVQEKFPKFLKTIFSFLRPFKYRFSTLALTHTSKHPKLKRPRVVMHAACGLFEALSLHEEGARYLATNKILPQMAEIFAQVDPFSGITSKDPLLSKRRLETTCNIGYVKMVGVLSQSSNGLKIMEQWQFFQLMHDIVEASATDESNNFLVFNLLACLEFSAASPTRHVLAKALTVSNWKIKLFVLENVLPKLSADDDSERLYVRNLVNLLYDSTDAVVKMAVDSLHDYFLVQRNLQKIELLIRARPSVSILERSHQGELLLLQFLAKASGFKYLLEEGFVDRRFDLSIKQLQGLSYLEKIEKRLRIHLHPFMGGLPDMNMGTDGDLHHFFHYLLATEEGFNYFNANRSYVNELVSSIDSLCRKLNILELALEQKADFSPDQSNPFANEQDVMNNAGLRHTQSKDSLALEEYSPVEKSNEWIFDEEYLLKRLKQYIWMAGEIASAKFGISILEPVYGADFTSGHIVEKLSDIFLSASNWQLRGLAFYQLGKVASTMEGIEILDELQWIACNTRDSDLLSLAYPNFMQDEVFTKVEVLNPYNDVSYFSLFGQDEELQLNGDLDLDDGVVIESYEEIDEKVLSLINYLSCVLGRIERKAKKELNRIKAENAKVFCNVGLFLKTIRLIDKGKFKYRTRVFIFELFDTMRIMETLVKRDRKNSTARR